MHARSGSHRYCRLLRLPIDAGSVPDSELKSSNLRAVGETSGLRHI